VFAVQGAASAERLPTRPAIGCPQETRPGPASSAKAAEPANSRHKRLRCGIQRIEVQSSDRDGCLWITELYTLWTGVSCIRGFPNSTINRADVENIGVRWMSRNRMNGAGDFVGWWRVGLVCAASFRSWSDRPPGSPNDLTRR